MANPETVTFILTRRCGEACSGCPVEIKKSDMQERFFSAAASSLGHAFPGLRRARLFGGEPLLNFSLVRRSVELLPVSLGVRDFELGTNARLLRGSRLVYLSDRPKVQVNVNAGVSISGRFLELPNLLWNLCLSPARPRRALQALRRIAAVSRGVPQRLNLLPEYYRPWTRD
jgi:hypothetical protein